MALEKFTYTFDKKKITLPKFDQLPFGIARKLRKADENEAMFLLIESVADDKDLEVIDTMPMSEIEKFIQAWMKDAGVSAGE